MSESTDSVPFLDLGLAHRPLRAAILADIAEIVDSGAFVNGPQVAAFEIAFARYCGARQCVGVASGLDALRLGLLAAGIAPGDEVVVPAATFVATFEAVTQAGGKPVVVDIGETDYCLDPAACEAALTARTRFVLPVHLYGQLADMRAIAALATRVGLLVLEDACQAHGASRDGIGAGTAGAAGAFSFYPGKNLGAFGDAGALVTADEGIASRARGLREHGQTAKYVHEAEGYTARLDTIQAAVLLRKLERIGAWNDERRAAATVYAAELEGVGDVRLPPVPAGSRPVWHLYVIRSARRDELAAFLAEQGIATGLHYPVPPHLTGAYEWLGHARGVFPVAEALSAEGLSLPIFPGISEQQLARVVGAVRDYFVRG